MQIQYFKVFCDLAQTKSFTKTARLNGITQSAVSQRIITFERTFHIRLIERGKKSFRLTREGQVVREYGRQIVQTYESLNSKLQEIKHIVSGTIRVATISSIGLHDLPPCLAKFMKLCPQVNVHVDYRHANRVYEDVLDTLTDFGLVAYPVRQANLEIVPFRMDKLVVICHPQHPLAKLKSVKLKALTDQKFIAFEPDIPTRQAVDRILRSRGVEVPIVMEFDNIETVKQAVEIGAGVSIVPQRTVVQEVARRTLAALPIADGDFHHPHGVLYRKNKVLSPAMKQFLAVLKEGTQRPE